MFHDIILHVSDHAAFGGLCCQLRAELRLSAGPLEEHHHFTGNAERQFSAVVFFDQRQSQVHARRDPCRGVDVAILDKDAVRVDMGLRVFPGQLCAGVPVSGDTASVKQPGGGQQKGTATDGADTTYGFRLPA
ncbi:hypothetical protein D3C87_1352620 [compost metagenome]